MQTLEKGNPIINTIKNNIEKIGRQLRIIEVCGTHTVSIYRNGFHSLFKGYIDFISGPGCPVCVTHEGYIDNLIELAKMNYTIYTFGDLMKVPGKSMSLAEAKAKGGKIKIMYSPVDAVENIAEDEEAIIAAVGFETTVPAFALSLEKVLEKDLKNVKFACELKTIDQPLKVLLKDHIKVDGLILPGHVATILGVDGFKFVEEFEIPSVISGFEKYDILLSLLSLTQSILDNDFTVKNEYKRIVKKEGNTVAKRYIERFFERTDAYFRGLGLIEGGGLRLKSEYSSFSVQLKYDYESFSNSACRCADVLTGKLKPFECPLFEKVCTPQTPKGACMVSQEGSCNAYFRFGKWK
ncbi:hydrogenase expression/formation protein HypD [Caldicellulosiruptor bescii]|uniref:Hydrogenase formation HypD protein n=2 Tax=Caldicellulosiruptor bescii TaxID=31899 RepID=B9MR89_CALBD|nr:hydrogenase formation protein HypD [Caldicellulosiruptor bescii]ACM60193.1 hydrogenase formation HypD protein [Caldicellulosiruptor bescii DSM 6725]PBC87608.1 hydrogenase expression/formation protein HypD [Caldicellulosiruptor bescii]PBC90541.1 hydrogenase expression/formation protein HypD [Caldicellulosiruptor bescii]PBD04027.1 hydrogenase expression/formation protein HypD [Caldicellulosiruptor bescii]PBD06338.1 hydrogenase expression/formation protein HypD [Caldicellulosiruptor bescii]